MNKQTEINVEELKRGGVIKLKGEDMFSLWVKTACCNLDSKQLVKLADITERYARGYLLFTTRQIPIIPFVNLKDVPEVKEELRQVAMELDRCGPRVRNVNVCYEANICPEAVTDAISLAEKLDVFFRDPVIHKIKLGVAGCGKDCIISRILTDIGFVGVERGGIAGYDAYVGGRLGLNPFLGLKMAEGLNEEACVRFVQNYFDLVKGQGQQGERSADLITRLGFEMVRQELNRDLGAGPPAVSVTCHTRLKEKETARTIVKVRATGGEVTAGQLRKIAYIAERYGAGFVHFAVRGAPEIPCVDEKDIPGVKRELAEVGLEPLDSGIDNLQSCFGNYCTESNVDPQFLLRRIEYMVGELGLNNRDIKISAAGCPNSCGIAQINDIGFYGVVEPVVAAESCNGCGLCLPVCRRQALEIKDKLVVIDREKCADCGQCIAVCPFDGMVEKRKGFAVFVGGQEGEDTRLGTEIARFVSTEEALELAGGCLRVIKQLGRNAATIIDNVGLERFKDMLAPIAR